MSKQPAEAAVPYTIKGIKAFKGADGNGLHASIYQGETKVATVRDAGIGAFLEVEFTHPDHKEPLLAFVASWYVDSGHEADDARVAAQILAKYRKAVEPATPQRKLEAWVAFEIARTQVEKRIARAQRRATKQ